MTSGSEYDDEMEWVMREILAAPDSDLSDDDPPLRPLCRECVREPPAEGSDLCRFCQVIDGG